MITDNLNYIVDDYGDVISVKDEIDMINQSRNCKSWIIAMFGEYSETIDCNDYNDGWNYYLINNILKE